MVCYTIWAGTFFMLIYLPGLMGEIVNAPLRVNIAVGVRGFFPSALAYLAWASVLKHGRQPSVHEGGAQQCACAEFAA